MTDRLEAIRAKARRLAITDLARLALERAERIAWLERDGKCQSLHKQDARIARLEAVAEAARSLLSICVELVPSPEAHLGARMGRLGLALAAIDEEEGT